MYQFLHYTDNLDKIRRKTIWEFSDITYQMIWNDIYIIFNPYIKEYTFYSIELGSLCKLDHVLGYKSNLQKFINIEIILCIFPDDNSKQYN